MTIPRAWYTYSGDVRLSFPYNERLVERLKRQVPPYARSYAPADKTWTVTSGYARLAVRLLLTAYPDAFIDRPRTRLEPAPIRATDRAFAALHLLPSAPPELVAGAYRILARLHHPDAGGDTVTMQAINTAYAALRPVTREASAS